MAINVKSFIEQEANLKFPLLMISDLGQIVLALGINTSDDQLLRVVVLYDNGYSIGDEIYTKNFSKKLRPYHGEITISNH
jgi:hypothetical protein